MAIIIKAGIFQQHAWAAIEASMNVSAGRGRSEFFEEEVDFQSCEQHLLYREIN